MLSISAYGEEKLHKKNVDWPLYGRSYDNQRFSELAQINANNVSALRLAWKINTGKIGSFQTSPLIVNGVMYLTTPYNDILYPVSTMWTK